MAAVFWHWKNGAPPPDELELYHIYKHTHALPYAGGLLEQPPFTIQMMLLAGHTYEALELMKDKDTPQWALKLSREAMEAAGVI